MLANGYFSSARLQWAAAFSFFLAALASGFSVALTNVAGLAGFLFWLFSGRMLHDLKMLAQDNLCRATGLFLLWIVLSLTWTQASLGLALNDLNQYRRLLFFLALYALCRSQPFLKRYLTGALFFSGLALALCSVAVSFSVPGFPAPDPYQGAVVIKDHISQGFLMGILVLSGARYAIGGSHTAIRLAGIFSVILAIFVTFFLTNGRTGYVCVTAAVMLTVLQVTQSLTLKQRLVYLTVAAACMTCVCLVSGRFEARMTQGLGELQAAAQSSSEQETSMGLRYRFWQQGLGMFKESVLIGCGAGAYSARFGQAASDVKAEGVAIGENPHSDYVSVASQWGLFGLGLLAALFGVAYARSRVLDTGDKLLLQGTLVLFAIGAIFNCFLTGNTEASVLSTVLAALAQRHKR